jgi:hypothetical protein
MKQKHQLENKIKEVEATTRKQREMNNNNNFYERIENMTIIQFSNEEIEMMRFQVLMAASHKTSHLQEMELLEKDIDYNPHTKHRA